MAWSSPRTWVDDEIVTKALLDTELRDNLNELALHDHSGGSGSGTRAMGGSATGLISVYMRDGAGPGTPTGTISAVFATGSRLAMHSSGGTVVLFATSGHEHTLTQEQIFRESYPGAQGTLIAGGIMYAFRRDIPTLYTGSASSTIATAITVGGSGSRAVFVGAYAVLTKNIATNDVTLGLQVLRDGTVLGTDEVTPSTDPYGALALRFTTFVIAPTGSQTYVMRVKGTSGTTGGAVSHWLGGLLVVNEIRTP